MPDLQSTLMQILAKRGVGDVSTHLHEVMLARLNQRPESDPLRAIIGQMLTQSQPAGSQRKSTDPNKLLRAARDVINELQARNTALAAALGGCADCWGTDPACNQCSGLGKPGWLVPNRTAFATWVAPAINAMRQSIQAEQPDTGGELP